MRAEKLTPQSYRAVRRWFRKQVVTRPAVYYTLIKLFRPASKNLAVHRGTQIVMDGYGGSGNTFLELAFRSAQTGPIEMAHHLHAPAQIIRGVEWNIPTIVLLREPQDAISSGISRRLVAYDDDAIRESLDNYILFYRTVMPYKNDVVVAPFREAMKDFGVFVRQLNEKFGCNFVPFDHTEENVRKIQAGQEQAKPNSARPLDKKDVKDRLMSDIHAERLAEAKQLFEAFHP